MNNFVGLPLTSKNILLISPEPWGHIFVSKHHYAIHLGKRGNKVFFLNPPGKIIKISNTGYENVWEVNYQGFPRGLRYFPSPIQKLFFNKVFQQLQNLTEVHFDIIWSFDNSVFYDFSALPNEVFKICHIVDLNQDFEIAKAVATADICLCTTDFIKKKLLTFNAKVYKINHGFVQKEVNRAKLPGGNNIKALYVGNIASFYFDWKLFFEVASNNRQIDFILIGPEGEKVHKQGNKTEFSKYREQIKDLSNIFFVGKIPAELIINYLVEADLLLITYCADQYGEQLANPHKMMEYLASGKMIVATKTLEYSELADNGLILMSKENADFPVIFQAAINDLNYWNSLEKQKGRKSYALQNTYDKQINRIEAIISTLDEGSVS